MSDLEKIIETAVATLGLGAGVGGTIFVMRYLWSTFKRILGAATWRE